jgi:hypothetical protein
MEVRGVCYHLDGDVESKNLSAKGNRFWFYILSVSRDQNQVTVEF